MTLERKWDHLRTLLREMGRAVVAYSGGVDSSLLLAAASDALGPRCIAVTASSETYPPAELASAKEFCLGLGVTHRIVLTEELSRDDFAGNTPDRCYDLQARAVRRSQADCRAGGHRVHPRRIERR